MIKFTQDFSDPEIVDLLMKKSLERKDSRKSLLLHQVGLILTAPAVVYLWGRSGSFSIWFVLYFLMILGLLIGSKEQQARGLREKFKAMDADDGPKPEYTVDRDGILLHTKREDTRIHWSHFISWGTQGRLLYLETITHTFIVCHARQLSPEDLLAFKALAAEQIGTKQ